MKKSLRIVAWLLCFATVLSLSVFAASNLKSEAPKSTVVYLGDVNQDGIINSLDAALILKFDASLIDSLPVVEIPDAPAVSEPSEESESSEEIIVETPVDPFTGIDFVISGISPFCEISVNNAACSVDAQLYVEYSFDKAQYANGETAVVTASLTQEAVDNHYVLTAETYSYEMPLQPEYITSLEGLDLSFLIQEQLDNITAQAYSARDTNYLCGRMNHYGYSFVSIENIDVYFMSLKQIKIPNFDERTLPFNRVSFMHKVNFNTVYHGMLSRWCVLTATNIVKYPDGTIKWGINSHEEYNFIDDTRDSYGGYSYEDSIEQMIMNFRQNYNISEVPHADIYGEEVVPEESSAE